MRTKSRLPVLLALAAAVAVLSLALGAGAASAATVKYSPCYVDQKTGRKMCIRQELRNGKWVKTHRCTYSKTTGKRLWCTRLPRSSSASSSCPIEGGLMADSSTPRGAVADIVSFVRKPYMVDGQRVFENGMPVWVLSATLTKPGYALCRVVVTHFPNGEKEEITLVPVGGRASTRLPTNDIPSIGASARRTNVS
jgi:hypothetical protein